MQVDKFFLRYTPQARLPHLQCVTYTYTNARLCGLARIKSTLTKYSKLDFIKPRRCWSEPNRLKATNTGHRVIIRISLKQVTLTSHVPSNWRTGQLPETDFVGQNWEESQRTVRSKRGGGTHTLMNMQSMPYT